MIEVNYNLFFWAVDNSIKTLILQIDVKLVASIIDDLAIDNMDYIFGVLDSWSKVVSLNFIESSIFPI